MGAGIKLGVGSRSSGSGGGSVGLQFPSNANISASLQAVSDKSGTASPLYLSTTQVAVSSNLSVVNGINSLLLEVYKTYTNASNYHKISIGESAYGGFGITSEGLGTGANQIFYIGNRGSGGIRLAPNGGTEIGRAHV